VNPFRKLWLAAKVKAALGGDMDAFKAVFGWLLKSKWASGHRRQISVGLTVLTTLLTFGAGPLAGLIPALANPGVNEVLLGLASYFGVVGIAFKEEPTQ
jgi:hypothetical protein